jgi:HlyD family secretion protein
MLVAGLAVVALVAVLAWKMNARGQPVEAAVVATGEIREFVDEQGVTALPRTYLITMPFEGRLEPISLSAGDPVKAGDPVAQIVAKDLDEEVTLARTAVERLEAQITENNDISVEMTTRQQAEHFVDSMEDTVKAAEARKTATSEKLQLAESTLGRLRSLFRRQPPAAAPEEVERAEVGLVDAQVDYQQSDLIWKSMASIKAATALLPTIVTQQIAKKDLSREVLQKQRAEAEVRLRQALTRQERGVMRSPVDGVVLDRFVDNEKLLPGGAELMEVGRLEDLEVEAEILSQDVVRVSEGDEVEIYGPALGVSQGAGVRGIVHKIHPEGFTKKSSLGVEQQRVKVVVRFAPEVLAQFLQHGVRVGYRVRVRIFTDAKSNALLVPRSALFRAADGNWQVYRIVDHQARLTPVKVGLMNDQVVEIASGSSANDIVILAPENSITDGTAVDPILKNSNQQITSTD